VPKRGLKALVEGAESVVLSSGNAVLVREGEQFRKMYILIDADSETCVNVTKNGKVRRQREWVDEGFLGIL
jgi:hypothetical protein